MRWSTLVVVFAVGCSPLTEPRGAPVLGAIAGYTDRDPRIDLAVEGRTVRVTVVTYGGPCDSAAQTSARVSSLDAEIVPYDYRGGCPQRSLETIEHAVTIVFAESGTARVTVRGIDASTRSSANLVGDTVAVLREVVLR